MAEAISAHSLTSTAQHSVHDSVFTALHRYTVKIFNRSAAAAFQYSEEVEWFAAAAGGAHRRPAGRILYRCSMREQHSLDREALSFAFSLSFSHFHLLNGALG